MDVSRLLLSVVMVMSTSDGISEASDPSCFHLEQKEYKVIKGEAFYYVPYDMGDPNLPDENITWYKNGPEVMNITTDETHRIHYHGGALFFLNISANDAGCHSARHIEPSGECFYYHLKIEVFNETSRENLTYGSIRNSDQNKNIPCPDSVINTCKTLNGNFTWLKGKNLIPGQHRERLWIKDATKDDEDIYTCICTWTHNHKLHDSSGSRRLFASESFTVIIVFLALGVCLILFAAVVVKYFAVNLVLSVRPHCLPRRRTKETMYTVYSMGIRSNHIQQSPRLQQSIVSQ